MKKFLAILALVVTFAAPVLATNEGNPCGNHGNNCQCETVDTGVEVDTTVVCAAVAEAYAASFAKSVSTAVSQAVSESSSSASASCEAAQASCELSAANSNEATASCGNTSVVCGYTGDIDERLCEKVRFKYNADGQLKSKRCVRWVSGPVVPGPTL